MRIAPFFWRKASATVGRSDCARVRCGRRRPAIPVTPRARPDQWKTTGVLQAGAQLQFTATAYCKGETTSSGVVVRTGVAAADPELLPVGTVMRVDMPSPRYSGIWTVMDTGPAVQGPHRGPLSLELQRSTGLRAATRSPHGSPARLESPSQHAPRINEPGPAPRPSSASPGIPRGCRRPAVTPRKSDTRSAERLFRRRETFADMTRTAGTI